MSELDFLDYTDAADEAADTRRIQQHVYADLASLNPAPTPAEGEAIATSEEGGTGIADVGMKVLETLEAIGSPLEGLWESAIAATDVFDQDIPFSQKMIEGGRAGLQAFGDRVQYAMQKVSGVVGEEAAPTTVQDVFRKQGIIPEDDIETTSMMYGLMAPDIAMGVAGMAPGLVRLGRKLLGRAGRGKALTNAVKSDKLLNTSENIVYANAAEGGDQVAFNALVQDATEQSVDKVAKAEFADAATHAKAAEKSEGVLPTKLEEEEVYVKALMKFEKTNLSHKDAAVRAAGLAKSFEEISGLKLRPGAFDDAEMAGTLARLRLMDQAVVAAGEAVKKNPTVLNTATYKEAISRMEDILVTGATGGRRGGQALRQLRADVNPEAALLRQKQQFIKRHASKLKTVESDPEELRALLLRDMNGIKQRSRFITAAGKVLRSGVAGVRGINDALYMVWNNSILSAVTTHVRNVGTAGWNIFQEGVGQAITNPKASAAYFHGTAEGFIDAIRSAGRSISRRGMPVGARIYPDDLRRVTRTSREGYVAVLPSEKIGLSSSNWLGWGLDTIAKTITVPWKTLSAEDYFMKQIAYRAGLRRDAYIDSLEFVKTSTKKRAYKNFIDEPSYQRKAVRHAQDLTYTNEVQSQLGKLAVKASQNRLGRWIVPFVRTNINIISSALANTPYGALGTLFKAVTGDARKSSKLYRKAVQRFGTGTAIPFAMVYSLSDNITGAPSVHGWGSRQTYDDYGRPSYSILVGDRWVNYGWIEPLRFLLGGAATFRDMMSQVDDESMWKDVAMSFIAPYYYAVIDQNFLENSIKVIGAMNSYVRAQEADDSKATERSWIRLKFIADQYTTQMIPFANFMKAGTKDIDGQFRIAETWREKVIRMVPWESKQLPPRYDLFGNPAEYRDVLGWSKAISPIGSSKYVNNPMVDEMARIKLEIPIMRWNIQGTDIRLTPEQMSTAQKISGQGGPRIKPMAKIISDYMRSPVYSRSNDEDRRRDLLSIIRSNYQKSKYHVVRSTTGKNIKQIRIKKAREQKRRKRGMPRM